MCGFTGYLSTANNNYKIKSDLIIQKMTNSLVHRGPDSEGYWHDSQSEIMLGFRRLAILDISTNGNQPMISKSGKYVISFNGEFTHDFSKPAGMKQKLVDISKLKKFGWQHKTSLTDGLKMTYAYFLNGTN